MNNQNQGIESAALGVYERDGSLLVPGLLSDEECEHLKAEAVSVMAAHSRPGSTVYVGPSVVSPVFRQLADDERFVSILRMLMSDGVMFLSDKIVFKSAAATLATPWHIDSFYWRGTRPKISVWIALDDVEASNGALMVVKGSHRRAWNSSESAGGGQATEFQTVIDTKQWADDDEVVCQARRGSAIFFPDTLVHGSTPNTDGLDRYSIISTYHAPGADEPFDLHFPARHVIV